MYLLMYNRSTNLGELQLFGNINVPNFPLHGTAINESVYMFHPSITYLERIGQLFLLYSLRRHFVRQFLGLFH